MQMPSDALRATSDELLRDLDVLAALEAEKRTLAPDDPRVAELATRIAEIAERLLGESVRQRELTVHASRALGDPSADASSASIEDTPRPIHDILAEWRDAERRQAAAEPGSVEAAEARALVEALRREYQRARAAAES